jgi:hypothetical protein
VEMPGNAALANMPSVRSLGMYGRVLRRSVTEFADKFRLFYSHVAISGYECCDSKIHPSLRDEIGIIGGRIERVDW